MRDTLPAPVLAPTLDAPDDVDPAAPAITPADFMHATGGCMFPGTRWFTPVIPAAT